MVKDIIGGIIVGKHPRTAIHRQWDAREGRATIAARFRSRPLLEARSRLALADAYLELGDVVRAEPHIAACHRPPLGAPRPQEPRYARGKGSPRDQATLRFLESADKQRESRAHRAREVLAGAAACWGCAHPDTIDSMALLASVLSQLQQFDEAQHLAEQERRRPSHGLDPYGLCSARGTALSRVLWNCGDLNSAEYLLRWLVVNWEQPDGRPSEEMLWVLSDLADVLHRGSHRRGTFGLPGSH